jgi:hypothetical protein
LFLNSPEGPAQPTTKKIKPRSPIPLHVPRPSRIPTTDNLSYFNSPKKKRKRK